MSLVNGNKSGSDKPANRAELHSGAGRDGGGKSAAATNRQDEEERRHFLSDKKATKESRKAELARQESFGDQAKQQPSSSASMALGCLCRRKWILLALIIILSVAAIYCLPFIQIDARVPQELPHVPFNFKDGPLKESTASQFKVDKLFLDQIHGPESVAIDSSGNMYLAIEGGFILQALLNSSYRRVAPQPDQSAPSLIKIAELNGIKPAGYERRQQSAWRRECQLDDKLYNSTPANTNQQAFSSSVRVSRCSKPLGVRLSSDESYLYVVDTLNGLYRISLRVPDRPNSSQRLVTKLIDFKPGVKMTVPVFHPDQAVSQSRPLEMSTGELDNRPKRFKEVSLMAVDDLAIDYGAGTRGGDIIYLSDASQNWQAVSFFYDLLEGRPSGLILRYDTGLNQLSVIDPNQIARVRTSALDLANITSRLYTTFNTSSSEPYRGIGAPLLDENDVFDTRPLHFPNGLEIMDDKEALLVADTVNKRIIKHYIRGPRVGTSDHWAWTPNYPDNIRRGYDKGQETYWVIGCGQDTTDKIDLLRWLRTWPMVRKYMLKNIYLLGWVIETIGVGLGSHNMRDYGYNLKTGHSICQGVCMGMMVLQYNKHGDIIRSVYSHEFPNDLVYYSQVNEFIDTANHEHVLYLSSPAYNYVTKLTLPTESFTSSYGDIVE